MSSRLRKGEWQDLAAELGDVLGLGVGDCEFDPDIGLVALASALKERIKEWPTTDDGPLSDVDIADICHRVAHMDGDTVVDKVAACSMELESLRAQTPIPISYAPKDGTKILGCFSDGTRKHVWYSHISGTWQPREPVGWLLLPQEDAKALLLEASP